MARGDENQRRKPKVPCVNFTYKSSHDDNTDDDDEYNEAEDQKPAAVVLPPIVSNNKSNKKQKINIRENESNYDIMTSDELPSNESIENDLLGFCCSKNCHCSKKQKRLANADGRYITPDCINSLWHRRCCHSVYDHNKEWLSPIEDVSTKIEELLFDESQTNFINDGGFLRYGKKLNIIQRYETAKRNESELRNEDHEAGMFYITF